MVHYSIRMDGCILPEADRKTDQQYFRARQHGHLGSVTLNLPSETEVGSAEEQPAKG